MRLRQGLGGQESVQFNVRRRKQVLLPKVHERAAAAAEVYNIVHGTLYFNSHYYIVMGTEGIRTIS